ncbi:serine/threonine protein kinase-like protein ACR4-like, partial [Trifolium pratense]
GERLIVMEFVRMANLEFYLHENHDGGSSSLLDWNKRFKIAAGVAKGLQYLHEVVAPNIVHEKRGLIGYVDDEYWNEGLRGGSVCKESDVYGLGVVLLELLSGRRCEGGLLVKWALPLIKDMRFSEVLDPKLIIPSNMKAIVRLAKVASACVGNSRKCRPCVNHVANILNDLETEVCLLSS